MRRIYRKAWIQRAIKQSRKTISVMGKKRFISLSSRECLVCVYLHARGIKPYCVVRRCECPALVMCQKFLVIVGNYNKHYSQKYIIDMQQHIKELQEEIK